MPELSQEDVEKFNVYYEKACSELEGLLIFGGYSSLNLSAEQKTRMLSAASLLEKAISIYMEHWQSLLFMGKINQSLGKHELALEFFDAAMKINLESPLIALEASLSAMGLDQVDLALQYSKEAISRKPDDPVVLGNYSLNLLVSGNLFAAKEAIENALLLHPGDKTNQKIRKKIYRVINGKETTPTFKDLTTQ